MKIDKKQLFICLFLVFIAFFIRCFKLNDFLFFGFEQGRDALIVQDIINLRHFPLVGPSTSFPGIFHGSYYYYLLAVLYFLGSGNPLFVIFFLALIGSLSTMIGYFFAKDVFNSYKWGIIYGILISFSFEYILYSRWLSNVSCAVPLTLLAFCMLWKYHKFNSSIFLVMFSLFASFASLFEMVLLPQFLFTLVLSYLFKIIKVSLKDIILGILVSIMVFSPLILFDLRNDHISSKSFFRFFTESKTSNNYYDSVKMCFIQTNAQFQRTLLYSENEFIKIFFLLISITGLWLYLKEDEKEKYKKVLFFIFWSLMSLPLIFIGPGNTQNYLGVGLAWLFLFCFMLKGFWNHKIYYVLVFLVIVTIYSWTLSLQDLSINKNIIFTTIQDDLNYTDQKRILSYIHQDANGQPYKLIAFTIPYLQPEGWEYLHSYFYSQDSNKDAKILYIIIEKHVAPEWGNKWITELGKTELLNEVQFGLLLVQKRILK